MDRIRVSNKTKNPKRYFPFSRILEQKKGLDNMVAEGIIITGERCNQELRIFKI